jgi:glycosyltransferase involved in cell wall biosynthesis
VNSSSIVAPFTDLSGFASGKVKVIHNGITPLAASDNGAAIRNEARIPVDAFVIGTVARLAIQKRIDRLAEALALLPANVHCIVAGEGTRRAEIERVIEQYGIGSRFHLLGHRDDVANVIAAMDVYVVSSDSEGLSNAMLEAMSAGKPVVSTDVSGAADALAPSAEHDAAGIIVERSPQAIADGVSTLMRDRQLRARLADSAARRAASGFSIRQMLDEWEAFLAAAP